MTPKISKSAMMFISNRDLFAALRLSGPALKQVRKAVRAGRWRAASAAWAEYFAARQEPVNMAAPVAVGPDPHMLHEAQRLLDHEIQGWHQVTHKFGKEVDFNAEWGVSGKYGMHYLGWMEPLRVAFESTADAKYPECFDDLFNQWYEQRDHVDHPIAGLHVIFYELGVGGRTPRLIDHYFSYRKMGVLGARTHRRLLKTILGGCRWLYLLEKDDGYRDGNWQMCGAWALVYAGALFPEFKEARAWVMMGVKRLLEHIERDFYADGGHLERASGYGSWCTQMAEDLLRISKLNPHVKLKVDLVERITRMYDWWLSLATPLGESQGFNDGGFGCLDATLVRGAEFTGDGRYLWPIRERVASAGDVAPREPEYTSIDQRASGFAAMRSGWNPGDLYVIINYGPWGGGHTHNGLLDFAMYAHGAPVTMEANRWGAYDNPLDRYFRSPQAHNQVVVNDTPMERTHHRGEDPIWATGKRLDYFSAINGAYRDQFGVTIERRFVCLKPDYLLVSDTVTESRDHHSYTWYLHAPARWEASPERAFTNSSPGVLVVPAQPEEIRHLRQGTAYEARDGAPGPRPDRYWIGLQKWAAAEAQRTVVYDVALIPFKKTAGRISVRRHTATVQGVEVGADIARGVQVRRRGGMDLIVYGQPHEETACHGLRFVGCLCVLSIRGGEPVHVAVMDGGEVVYEDRPLLEGSAAGLTERSLC